MSSEHVKIKLQQDAAKAKEELDTLCAKCEMDETQIKAIVANDRLKLNQKVEEALTRGWIEWLAQAVKLQIFLADAANKKNEGHGFYKTVDENSFQILCENLAKEF